MASELTPQMKVSDLLDNNPALLGVFTRMGFCFGYGDATVEDICKAAGIDPNGFLIICRVYSQEGFRPSADDLKDVDLSVIVKYLSLSHDYYLNVAIKDLAAGIGRMIVPCGDNMQRAIWNFFTEFKEELQKHFSYEESFIFPNVGNLDAGLPTEDHSGVEEAL